MTQKKKPGLRRLLSAVRQEVRHLFGSYTPFLEWLDCAAWLVHERRVRKVMRSAHGAQWRSQLAQFEQRQQAELYHMRRELGAHCETFRKLGQDLSAAADTLDNTGVTHGQAG